MCNWNAYTAYCNKIFTEVFIICWYFSRHCFCLFGQRLMPGDRYHFSLWIPRKNIPLMTRHYHSHQNQLLARLQCRPCLMFQKQPHRGHCKYSRDICSVFNSFLMLGLIGWYYLWYALFWSSRINGWHRQVDSRPSLAFLAWCSWKP